MLWLRVALFTVQGAYCSVLWGVMRPFPRCHGHSVECPVRLMYLNTQCTAGGLEASLSCFILFAESRCKVTRQPPDPVTMPSLTLSCLLCHGELCSFRTVSQIGSFSFKFPFLAYFFFFITAMRKEWQHPNLTSTEWSVKPIFPFFSIHKLYGEKI